MSEKYTVVVAGPSGYRFHGHIDPAEALTECRERWRRQRDQAVAVLAALDAGDARVFHQRGVHVIRDRRDVTPAEPEPEVSAAGEIPDLMATLEESLAEARLVQGGGS